MERSSGITRRDMLKKGTLVGAVVWATPVIQTVGISRAMAAEPSPGDEQLIFFDDFSQEGPPQLNYRNFQNWNVSDGSVDLLDPDNVSQFGIPNGLSSTNFVDLDGSTGNAGTMTTTQEFDLGPGTYRLSFALAGNHRNAAGETVTLLIGNGTILVGPLSFTRDENDAFTVSEVTFSGGSPGTMGRIVFNHGGGDNIGLLLDFVQLERLT